MHVLLYSVPPVLQQATTDPCLCQRLLDTHGQVWVSVLWGHCPFLLGPGAPKDLIVPSKSLFPQSCVSFGSSTVGLMVTSSKRAYAIPRSAAPRAPAPVAGQCWPVPLQETLKHSLWDNIKFKTVHQIHEVFGGKLFGCTISKSSPTSLIIID